MTTILGVFCVVGLVLAFIGKLLQDPEPVDQEKQDSHLFWVKGNRLYRDKAGGMNPIRIAPETELGIAQPFTPVPKRFTVRFKQTERVGQSTYRDAPSVERVRLEDAQALFVWLSQLRKIEIDWSGTDHCYTEQIKFLREESKRDDLPFTIDLN